MESKKVQADRTVPNNIPDIIIRNNEIRTRCYRCCNLRRQKCNQESSRKILKYKDLTTETERMWNETQK